MQGAEVAGGGADHVLPLGRVAEEVTYMLDGLPRR
jgi:hypothetical protein